MPVPPDRPDDETDVDREIRIEKMTRELDEIAGGTMLSGSFGPVSPEIEETFLDQVLAYERAEFDTNSTGSFNAASRCHRGQNSTTRP